jgi:hypothetical protein
MALEWVSVGIGGDLFKWNVAERRQKIFSFLGMKVYHLVQLLSECLVYV